MTCLKIVPKGNLSETMINWQALIGYEDNQIMTTIMSAELTKLFILHVFSMHAVPSHVTSDRGSEFVSHFFCSLRKALDMTLHFTSRYHPEGDGQTERTNQTLEQYIQVYSNYQ